MPEETVRSSLFELGARCFFGAWSLELGASCLGFQILKIKRRPARPAASWISSLTLIHRASESVLMAHRLCLAQRNHAHGTHDTDEVWSSRQAYCQDPVQL